MYLSVGVPACRTVAHPLPVDTREDQIEALRVLSAGNTIIIVLLGAVLALQVRSPRALCPAIPGGLRARSGCILNSAFVLIFPRFCLGGQIGEEYARRAEAKEAARFAAADKVDEPASSETPAAGPAESRKER